MNNTIFFYGNEGDDEEASYHEMKEVGCTGCVGIVMFLGIICGMIVWLI